MNFQYQAKLRDHYAAVRARLGCAPTFELLEAPAPIVLLPPPAPSVVADPIPNQRWSSEWTVDPIGIEAETVAIRRALYIFARLRDADPSHHSVRHLQIAIAAAFKVDIDAYLGRSRRRGPARIRQIAMMLAGRVCGLSRMEVSRRFSREHATVLFAERRWRTSSMDSPAGSGASDGEHHGRKHR